MNSKLKNMEIVLNIGSIILFLAGLGLLLTWEIESSLIKVTSSSVIALFSIIFSFFIKYILKSDGCSKVMHYLGSTLLVLVSFIAVTSNIFNVSDKYFELLSAIPYLLILALSLFSVARFKHYSLIHLSLISLILIVYHVCIQYSAEYVYFFMLEAILLFILTFIKKREVSDFATTHSYLFVLVSLLFTFNYSLFQESLLFGLNMALTFRALYKDKNVLCELIALGYIGASLISYGVTLNYNFDLSLSLLVIVFVTGILELLVNYYKVIDGNVNKVFYKIFFTSVYVITLLTSLIDGASLLSIFLPSTIFITLSSIGTTLLLKSNNDALIGIKILALIYAILINFNLFIYPISDVVYVYILSLSSIMMYIVFKDKIYKNTGSIVSFVLVLPLIVATKNVNLIFYLASCLLILLNAFVYTSSESYIDNNVKSGLLSVCCYALFAITADSISPITYLISSACLLILLVMNRNNIVRYVVSLFFLYFTFKGYINTAIVNFTYSDIVQIILNSVVYFTTVCLFVFNSITKKSNQDIVLSLFSGFGIFGLIFDYNGVAVILYSLFASICLLIFGVIKKEFKGVFCVGIIFSIMCIINLLSYVKGLPVVVYLIILGLALILTISILIYKYQKSPDRLVETVKSGVMEMANGIRFCPECGDKVVSGSSYCRECGCNLVGDDTYCSNCGRKILKGEKFCNDCGTKVK